MALGSEKNFRPAAVVEVSGDFYEDIRVIKLRSRLGEGGLGYLVRLWCWAAKWRSDGSMYDISDSAMEQASEYAHFGGKPKEGNPPGDFAKALRESGLLIDDGENPCLGGLGEFVFFHKAPRRKRG